MQIYSDMYRISYRDVGTAAHAGNTNTIEVKYWIPKAVHVYSSNRVAPGAMGPN